ncbi:hypothetical protein LCGC14_1262230 [marine sediment metagenome]|uniref:Uncharacterized protein n=1 Tax=marine sediment metagenome TaxID=412755 RepID=A0A0F9L2U1_9ZZZZ
MDLEEKFKKLMERYPDPKEFTMVLIGGGMLLGASGCYTTEELVNINMDILGLLGEVITDKISDVSEAFLLLDGISKEFIGKVADSLLKKKNIE